MSKYKIVKHHQFAYGPVTSRNGEKISVALLEETECIISTSYTVFEIKDKEQLDPEYLMMWFRRSEFDRYARYKSHGSVRELFDWQEMCDVELPVPSIEKQREIVREYNVVNDRITLNEKLIQKLEETAQAIYKQWFVDFEFQKEKPDLIDTEYATFTKIPKGWNIKPLKDICSKIGSGSTPRGGKEAYKSEGISLIRSMNVHDYQFAMNELAYINDEQAKKLINVEICTKDVLINITGVSVARCCVVPSYVLPARVNQHVMIIRPKQNISRYLQCALTSPQNKLSLLGTSEGASTREALTKKDIEEFLILLPPEKILNNFEKNADFLFAHIENLAQATQKLIKLKSIFLKRLIQA